MKKMLGFLAVLMLALAVVTPAAALGSAVGGGPGTRGNGDGVGVGLGSSHGLGLQGLKGPHSFQLAGTITAIGDGTITVHVTRGNRLVRPFIGQDVVITVPDRPGNIFHDGLITRKLTFSDLKVGQMVMANGTVNGEVWTSIRITVGVKLSTQP